MPPHAGTSAAFTVGARTCWAGALSAHGPIIAKTRARERMCIGTMMVMGRIDELLA
jgi:hypothetical protein